MPIQNAHLIKDKILSLIQAGGPTLPVHVARGTGLNSIFAGAFLSELYSDKKIKISHMKVGSSPLYFIPGQEQMLENFSNFLNNREKEAFALLREKKILEDSELEPAIRVALKELKDFAFQFQNPSNQQLYWRYLTLPEQEALNLLKSKTKQLQVKTAEKPKVEIKEKKLEEKKLEKKDEAREEIKTAEKSILKARLKKEKPEVLPIMKMEEETTLLVLDSPVKPKEKPIPEKSEFVLNVLKALQNNKIILLEEKDYKKKEFMGVGKINSDLGEVEIFIVAKDKKRISQEDLKSALQNLNTERKMVLFLTPGIADKKAEEFLNNYKGLIKLAKM